MSRLRSKHEGVLIFSDYKKTSFRILYVAVLIFLAVAAIISIFPPLWLFLSSFKTPEEILANNFVLFPETMDFKRISEIWQQFQFGRFYINSFILVAGAIVCSITFNGLLAYGTAVIKPKGWKVIDVMVMATLLIPAMINISPLYMNIIGIFNRINELFDTNVWQIPYFSYLPLWLIYGANAYYYVLFKVYFSSLPQPLFEAAKIDGASQIQMFRYILFPLSLPIIAVVTIFTMNAAWSDFLLPYLMTRVNQSEQPIMVKLYNMYANQMAQVTMQERLMTIMFSIVPPIILFMLFQRQIAQNVATTGLKE
ncbi:MAG: carbohydrate ABC transporter permease [Bacilli bacterium]|nr:carbohydrate ABC transporter permease [Bacilli bacterium]